jgi:hypothetical protein
MGRRLRGIAALAMVFAAPAAALAAPPPGAPREQLNAADNRRAQSVILRQSDMFSGFRTDPTRTPHLVPHCPDFPGDRSSVTISGDATSSFSYKGNVIASGSVFFKTYADADRYWARTVRARFATCDAEAFKSTLRKGIRAKTLMARQIPIGATGADGATAFRTITRLTVKDVTQDWYRTVVFIRSGRGLAIIETGFAVRACECQTGFARRLALRLIDANRG